MFMKYASVTFLRCILTALKGLISYMKTTPLNQMSPVNTFSYRKCNSTRTLGSSVGCLISPVGKIFLLFELFFYEILFFKGKYLTFPARDT